jgi:hypothetical protein
MVTNKEQKEYNNESKRRARKNKAIRDKELLNFLGNLTGDIKDVAIEIIRTANSNPLLGILVSVVTVDILSRLKIIDPGTAAGLYVAIGTIEGAEVATGVITSLTDVFHLFGKSPAAPNLIEPSATTIVYGQGNAIDLQALMSRIGKP